MGIHNFTCNDANSTETQILIIYAKVNLI